MFSEEEKRELLTVARGAIAEATQRASYQAPDPASRNLAQHCGAFVTIRVDQQLRGCIGYIESERPLTTVVAEVAAKAATDDPRFSPLTPGECAQASVQVSVLSPLRRIRTVNEIQVGIHGIVVATGRLRGLLLPQVAVEHHMTSTEFLEAAMQKAGLPHTMWGSPDVELYVFEAEVFEEAGILQ